MKGRQENLIDITTRATDVQREIRSKGGKARARRIKERKTVAEALREVLYAPINEGSKMTKLEGISNKAIKKMFDDPDIKDMKVLAEVLGETKQAPNSTGELTIIVKSSREREQLENLGNLNV